MKMPAFLLSTFLSMNKVRISQQFFNAIGTTGLGQGRYGD